MPLLVDQYGREVSEGDTVLLQNVMNYPFAVVNISEIAAPTPIPGMGTMMLTRITLRTEITLHAAPPPPGQRAALPLYLTKKADKPVEAPSLVV